jgi:hypothetical protein
MREDSKMNTVFVKPSEGARIRQPDRNGRVMPDAGAMVPRDVYYERLILTGDVVVTDPPAPPRAPKSVSGVSLPRTDEDAAN